MFRHINGCISTLCLLMICAVADAQVRRPSPQPPPTMPRARPFPQASIEGSIARIESEKVVLRFDDGREAAYTVDARTRYLIDGQESALADLKEGAPVSLFLDPRERGGYVTFLRVLQRDDRPADIRALRTGFESAEARPSSSLTVRGRILSIEEDRLRFKALDGETMTFQLNQDVRVELGSRTGRVADLKANQPAVVQTLLDGRGNRLVSVQLSSAGASDGSPSPGQVEKTAPEVKVKVQQP